VKVLVILEDHRNDQYILKPIIKAMLTSLGRPQATVNFGPVPPLQGISQALKWENIRETCTRVAPH
jgi:hypothetical protein